MCSPMRQVAPRENACSPMWAACGVRPFQRRHDHVCRDSVPCCEPTAIVQSPPADKDKLALSSSSNLPEQCRRPKSNWRLITIGDRKFTLPPLQSSVQLLPQPSDQKDQPTRTLQPNLNSKPTSQVQNSQPENHVESNSNPVQSPSASSCLMSNTSSKLTNLSTPSLLDSQVFTFAIRSCSQCC